MPRAHNDRWIVRVLSPVNGDELWSCKGKVLEEIADKWKEETNNNYITKSILTRLSLSKNKNPLLKLERLAGMDYK